MEITRRLAIWLKGKEFTSETNADGNIVVTPKSNKYLYAVIDPEKKEATYWQNFAEPLIAAYIPEKEVDDLRYFVNLLIGDD